MSDNIKERILNSLPDYIDSIREDFEDDHDDEVKVTTEVLIPEGCAEVLWSTKLYGNQRFHIVVVELDGEGNAIDQ